MHTSNSSQTPAGKNNLLKLDCNELLLGMFVAELDCAWSATPFPVGGFHLKKADDLETLQKFCKSVQIDTSRGVSPKSRMKSNLTVLSSARRDAPIAATMKVNRDYYQTSHTIKQDLDQALKLYRALQESYAVIRQRIREDREFDLTATEQVMDELIDLILANPQTLVWLLNTDPSKTTPTRYCVRAAIWAAILGRQVGLKQTQIRVLFEGTLLADIGMSLIPERLINKRGPFNKREFRAYSRHVELGVQLLVTHTDLDERIRQIVQCHHERHDGHGFPKRLRGDRIPLLARFAILAYSFERLLRSDHQQTLGSPVKAIARLYKQRALKFPEQLVAEFNHIVGIYPLGSVIELDTGELAIVTEQNPEQRLLPKLAVVTSTHQQPLKKPIVVNLVQQSGKVERRIKGVPKDKARINLADYSLRLQGVKQGKSFLGISF